MMTPAHLVMKTAMMKPHAVARDFEVAQLHHLNSSVALNIFHFSFFLLPFFYDNVVANRSRQTFRSRISTCMQNVGPSELKSVGLLILDWHVQFNKPRRYSYTTAQTRDLTTKGNKRHTRLGCSNLRSGSIFVSL